MKIKKKKRLYGKEEIQITPFVKSLGRVVKLDPDVDYKEIILQHLMNKYK